MVKKIELAEKLGLHVATISRILNEVPNYRASKETVRKVFETAREMGYDFERQKRFYKRRHKRVSADARVKLHARTSDGSIISHSARMVNIGEGGVLLVDFRPRIVTLPMREEDLTLEVVSGGLKGVRATCEVVRVGRHGESFGICVQMGSLAPGDKEKLKAYINSKSIAEK
jgi:hypothetical protein